jgi:hypothetical protein
MKKLLVLTVLSLCASVSFAKSDNVYESFQESSKKETFLKDYINQYPYLKEMIGNKKCEKVSHINQLAENNMVVHLQVSCSNVKDNFHILMTKFPNTSPVVNLCKDSAKKFKREFHCK